MLFAREFLSPSSVDWTGIEEAVWAPPPPHSSHVGLGKFPLSFHFLWGKTEMVDPPQELGRHKSVRACERLRNPESSLQSHLAPPFLHPLKLRTFLKHTTTCLGGKKKVPRKYSQSWFRVWGGGGWGRDPNVGGLSWEKGDKGVTSICKGKAHAGMSEIREKDNTGA